MTRWLPLLQPQLDAELIMRTIIWFVLLFGVAVLAASTLGTNDGLVTFYWRGWRADVSLNLFLLTTVGLCSVIVIAIQTISALVGLPVRAREWRLARRDRTAQAALRDALAQYFGGRYSRAQKAAQRALHIQTNTPELPQDNEFTMLSHLLTAGSAHRMQNRVVRDEQLQLAFDLSRRSAAARSVDEGARLLAAEWALDDRDAPRALDLLRDLPVGVARRTHALRLKLQAARLGRQPQDALKTARLLAKHQAFSKVAAESLLRSLAFESLDAAHDIDQLKRVWLQLDALDRRDAFVAARAADRAAGFGAFDEARSWLRSFWDQMPQLSADERAVVAMSLVNTLPGLGLDWLPRLDSAITAFPREGAVVLAVGAALAERQLWGKARRWLEQAVLDVELTDTARRKAWLLLAKLAQEESNSTRVAECYEAAAKLV
jgi:HemY protein